MPMKWHTIWHEVLFHIWVTFLPQMRKACGYKIIAHYPCSVILLCAFAANDYEPAPLKVHPK